MLADAAKAHDLTFVALRYFNVAGADPKGRAGQSTPNATQLIKAACEATMGQIPLPATTGITFSMAETERTLPFFVVFGPNTR